MVGARANSERAAQAVLGLMQSTVGSAQETGLFAQVKGIKEKEKLAKVCC